MKKLLDSPFADLKKVLDSLQVDTDVRATVRIDSTRLQRTGIPEVILAQWKPVEILLENILRLVIANGRVLVYKCQTEKIEKIRQEFSQEYQVEISAVAYAVIVSKKGVDRKSTRLNSSH